MYLRHRTITHRTLHRDPSHGYVDGVCAGIARRFDVEPLFVRAAAVIAALWATTPTLLAYAVLWCALPRRAFRHDWT
jgi:phage shock protein PspC (stress-responsive transcriptional regulator)